MLTKPYDLFHQYLRQSLLLAISAAALMLVLSCSEPPPPKIPGNLVSYAATYMQGIYKSENGGESWYPLHADQKQLNTYFKNLYQSPSDRNKIYITTSGAGLFTLDPRTKSLQPIEEFRDRIITSLTFLPSEPNPKSAGVLVATADSGVFKDDNDGGVFQQFNNGMIYREVNALHSYSDKVYAGTVKGLFQWDRKLNRWENISAGIKNRNIISICSLPSGQIYAGAGVYEGERGMFEDIPCFYKSSDSGVTWEPVDAGLEDGTIIYRIKVNEKHPERVYLGTSEGVYRSTDGGKNWSDVNDRLPKVLKVFAIEITNLEDGTDVIILATSRGIFMANDTDQVSWIPRSYGLPPTAITDILPVMP